MVMQRFACLKGDIIKAIALVCLAVGVVGVSYGTLAMAYGFALWVPLLLSVSVLAGASEFIFIGIVASGGSRLRRRRQVCWSTPAICRSASPCGIWWAAARKGCWARTS